jgi:hypothetical protein
MTILAPRCSAALRLRCDPALRKPRPGPVAWGAAGVQQFGPENIGGTPAMEVWNNVFAAVVLVAIVAAIAYGLATNPIAAVVVLLVVAGAILSLWMKKDPQR